MLKRLLVPAVAAFIMVLLMATVVFRQTGGVDLSFSDSFTSPAEAAKAPLQQTGAFATSKADASVH